MACTKPPACTGELDRLISIREQVLTPDGAGGSTVTWNEVIQVWAKIEQSGGGETYAHDRVESRASHKFIFRWIPDFKLLATYQLVLIDDGYGNEVEFNIRLVNDEKYRNAWYIVHADRGVVQ